MQGHLYVAGGRQRGLRPLSAPLDWYRYEAAVIVRLDATTGEGEPVVDYVSPPEVVPDDDPTILFKSGTLVGDLLYLTTQTEVLVYRVPGLELVRHVSLPQFNDLHHVVPTGDGNLLVAASGMDMVMEVRPDDQLGRLWDVTGNGLWHRFSPEADYRKVATTKPHASHPNYLFTIGDEVWATRFEQRDAVSVINPERRIQIGLERVHDGVRVGTQVYFTTVDGRLVIVDTETLEIARVIDLKASHPPDTLLGWTRGLHVMDGKVWVGFSRIRPTKFRENVGWVARGFRRDFGTHIGLYDLETGDCLAQHPLEGFGLSAVFGIYPAPD